MLRVKITDGRLDRVEVEGLAEIEAVTNFLTAYTSFVQTPPANVPSARQRPSRAINPDDVAEALRAIGRPASAPEIRAELKARGITTTPSRKDGDLREAMRDDPHQRFTRNGTGRGGRWMLREWAISSGTGDAAKSGGAADSLHLS
jgi:hypothetical protein